MSQTGDGKTVSGAHVCLVRHVASRGQWPEGVLASGCCPSSEWMVPWKIWLLSLCCAHFPVGSMSLEISRKNRIGEREVETPGRTRCVLLSKEDFVPHD